MGTSSSGGFSSFESPAYTGGVGLATVCSSVALPEDKALEPWVVSSSVPRAAHALVHTVPCISLTTCNTSVETSRNPPL